jgi:hypothetical protein
MLTMGLRVGIAFESAEYLPVPAMKASNEMHMATAETR